MNCLCSELGAVSGSFPLEGGRAKEVKLAVKVGKYSAGQLGTFCNSCNSVNVYLFVPKSFPVMFIDWF